MGGTLPKFLLWLYVLVEHPSQVFFIAIESQLIDFYAFRSLIASQ